MPLLPLETYLFPQTLLGDFEAVEGAGWCVLHTRPRAEKSLVRRLLGRQIPFYLPLYPRQRRFGGRARTAYLPLFPGYVFLHGDDDARRTALETNLIVRTLPVIDQVQLLEDLRRVHCLVDHGTSVAPLDHLVPGTRVEISCGPLAGIEGTVIRRGNRLRFFVEVRLLQQAVEAEIESWMFRPIDVRQAAFAE